MGAVGLVFAPLAPLVAVAAAIVFWVFSWAYKYQLMFVFISKVESGGRVWNVVINRLLFSVVLMQALMILTIGLQYKFQSLQWLSTVPPVLFVVAFKLYLNRVFLPAFQFYMPTEEEIRLAKVHSERADNRGNRLEKRFGHPALVTDLFTPMLHATMMPLLSQVYHGKLGRDEAKLNEYGDRNRKHRLSQVVSRLQPFLRMIWSTILLSTEETEGSWTGMLALLRPRPYSTQHRLIWPNLSTMRVIRR